MKKEDAISIVVYVCMIAIAVIIGLTVIAGMFNISGLTSRLPIPNNIGFSIVTILLALIVNSLLMEVGHVIGAKIGGYSVVSFNVLGFCFYKKEGKWKFKFTDFDGLTGETKVCPKKENASPKAYVWIPLFIYLITLIGGIILYTVGNNNNVEVSNPLKWLALGSIIYIAISSMIALYNFVPFKLDTMTDGYRLTLISKKVNVEAYNELMKVENALREGQKVEKIRVFEEVTDFTADINLITVYEHLASSQFAEAESLIDKMIEKEDKISNATFNRLLAQKLYIKIMTTTLDEVKTYYNEKINDNVRRFISNDISMESLRAYVLIAGLLDESLGEVQFANSRKPKALKRALKSRAEIEEKLYKDALDLVLKSHPDWDMSKGA